MNNAILNCNESLDLCPMSTILDEIREAVEFHTRKPFYYSEWMIGGVATKTLALDDKIVEKYGESYIPVSVYTLWSTSGEWKGKVYTHVFQRDEKVPIFENSTFLNLSEMVS